MAPAIIATVIAIKGQAWARTGGGERRELHEGDKLRQGETLVTPDGSRVELELADGQSIAVADLPEVTLDTDMLVDTAATAEEAALQNTSLDEIVATFESDSDLSELFETPASTTGNAAADDDDLHPVYDLRRQAGH